MVAFKGTWRNSCIENWHAEGRLSDGAMMRINSRTTDAVRRRQARWTTEIGITSASGTALAKVDVEDADAFAIRLFRWITNPKRKLTIGITLGELARIGAGRRSGGLVDGHRPHGCRWPTTRSSAPTPARR
ncbi:hypothetical protein [Streptomyces niveus]|uniref:hypothetical protein n=1 Tax=Streptomyces niveus TaxID=193462 RepID=UPI0036D251C0